MPEFVEYRLRPVTRYIVSRYERGEEGDSASMGRGEYDNEETAYEVAYALCKAEHEALGWPAFDERMQYPRRLSDANSTMRVVAQEVLLEGLREFNSLGDGGSIG